MRPCEIRNPTCSHTTCFCTCIQAVDGNTCRLGSIFWKGQTSTMCPGLNRNPPTHACKQRHCVLCKLVQRGLGFVFTPCTSGPRFHFAGPQAARGGGAFRIAWLWDALGFGSGSADCSGEPAPQGEVSQSAEPFCVVWRLSTKSWIDLITGYACGLGISPNFEKPKRIAAGLFLPGSLGWGPQSAPWQVSLPPRWYIRAI